MINGYQLETKRFSLQIPTPKESTNPIAEVMSLEFIHAVKIVSRLPYVWDSSVLANIVVLPFLTDLSHDLKDLKPASCEVTWRVSIDG